MVIVLHRGILCVLLPFLGCASAPREKGSPSPEEAAVPATWADGLDGLVFGDEGAGAEQPARPETPAADLQEISRLAVEAVREDRLEDAARLLEDAVACAPEAERWHYERALADTLLALGRAPEAAKIYEGLLRLGGSAGGVETLGNLAAAYYRLGDASRARSASVRALEAVPGNAEALKTLGLVDLLDGEKERGAERLREALISNPSIPEALLALAEIEEEAGDREGALERYRKLLDLAEASEAAGRDPGRRIRGLFLFRPVAAGQGTELPGPGPSEELKARIQRLEGGGPRAP
jgi:tetratricopeptide (TPR) repeat protein